MTREIKFRGKAKLDGKWWFGNLVPKDTRGRTQINNPEHGGCFEIDPNTVGQFTGLHDKNGKDLYEGDIVHLDSWKPDAMQIAFIEGAFCLADANGHFLGDIHYIHHAEVEQCTILGNVHDNPLLLKQE